MSQKKSVLSRIIEDATTKTSKKELSLRETEVLFAKYLRSANKNMTYEEAAKIAKVTAYRVQTQKDINAIRKENSSNVNDFLSGKPFNPKNKFSF